MTEYKKMRITPKIARGFLANNYAANRKINKASVTAIAADMLAGRYVSDNGQTVTITSDGRLVDGQHRMSAIVKSGKAFDFLVCVIDANDVDQVFSTIDTGTARALSQFVSGPSRHNTSALAKIDNAFINGTGNMMVSLNGYVDGNRTRASIHSLSEYHEDNMARIVDVYNMSRRIASNARSGSIAAVGGAILLLQYLLLDQHIAAFADDLCSLTPERPVSMALIRKWARVHASDKHGAALREDLFLCFLAAYDIWCEGGRKTVIRDTEKTRDKYENLLQLQREIRRDNVIPFAG